MTTKKSISKPSEFDYDACFRGHKEIIDLAKVAAVNSTLANYQRCIAKADRGVDLWEIMYCCRRIFKKKIANVVFYDFVDSPAYCGSKKTAKQDMAFSPWWMNLNKDQQLIIRKITSKWSDNCLNYLPRFSFEQLASKASVLSKGVKEKDLTSLYNFFNPKYLGGDEVMASQHWELAKDLLEIDDESLQTIKHQALELAASESLESGEIQIKQKHALSVFQERGYDITLLVKPVKMSRAESLQQQVDDLTSKLENANLEITNLKKQLRQKDMRFKAESVPVSLPEGVAA